MAKSRGCFVSQRQYFAGSEVLYLQHRTQKYTKCVERTIKLKANSRATLSIFKHCQTIVEKLFDNQQNLLFAFVMMLIINELTMVEVLTDKDHFIYFMLV